MNNTKSLPRPQTDKSVRAQHTEEGAAWTASPSSRHGISASDSASRGRDVLGRQVPTTTHDGNHGGHDE